MPETYTGVVLCIAQAFRSTPPQSYVIAHKFLIYQFDVNLLHKKHHNWSDLFILYPFLRKIFLILAVILSFILQRFDYQPHTLLPVHMC